MAQGRRQDPGHALAWRGLGFLLSHPGTYFVNTGVPTGVANDEAFATRNCFTLIPVFE